MDGPPQDVGQSGSPGASTVRVSKKVRSKLESKMMMFRQSSHVTFLDSSGVGALLSLYNACLGKREFKLRHVQKPTVQAVMSSAIERISLSRRDSCLSNESLFRRKITFGPEERRLLGNSWRSARGSQSPGNSARRTRNRCSGEGNPGLVQRKGAGDKLWSQTLNRYVQPCLRQAQIGSVGMTAEDEIKSVRSASSRRSSETEAKDVDLRPLGHTHGGIVPAGRDCCHVPVQGLGQSLSPALGVWTKPGFTIARNRRLRCPGV